MRILFFLFFLFSLMNPGFAQEPVLPDTQTQQNLRALRKSVSHSLESGSISYEMDYRIAAVTNPDQFIDSANGSCKYLGKKCWYSIGGMEVFQDSSLTVVVFEEDQLIYLTRPNSMHSGFNAVSLLDSLLKGNQQVICTKQTEHGLEQYKVVFSQPVLYKELSFLVDKKGRMISSRQIVNQSLMSGDVQATGISGDWVVLDIRFKNWKSSSSGDPVFSLTHYLQKNADGWLASDRLAAYTVFIAHSSL